MADTVAFLNEECRMKNEEYGCVNIIIHSLKIEGFFVYNNHGKMK